MIKIKSIRRIETIVDVDIINEDQAFFIIEFEVALKDGIILRLEMHIGVDPPMHWEWIGSVEMFGGRLLDNSTTHRDLQQNSIDMLNELRSKDLVTFEQDSENPDLTIWNFKSMIDHVFWLERDFEFIEEHFLLLINELVEAAIPQDLLADEQE